MDANPEDTKRQELREWLARRLRWEDIPEPLWEALEGYIGAVLDRADLLDREDLLGLTKERIQFVKDMVPFFGANAEGSGSLKKLKRTPRSAHRREMYRESPIFDPMLDPLADIAANLVDKGFPIDSLDEHQQHRVRQLLNRRRLQQEQQTLGPIGDPVNMRVQAFCLYLAKLASEDPEVKRFREEVLGNSRLSRDQAEEFLHSPAVALFSSTWFTENGVPLLGHAARVLELKGSSTGWSRRLGGKARVEWEGRSITSAFTGTVLTSDPFERGMIGSEPVRALRGSALSDVVELQDYLCERFPWRRLNSDVLQGIMFILTGRVPWVEPIRATVPERYPDLYRTIDIAVWPWVPVEEVTALYERVRKELNPTPNTSPRRLALFMFIMQQSGVRVRGEGVDPEVPAWRELMDLWNTERPWRRIYPGEEWHYTDVRNFRRDFKQAFDQTVNFYRSDRWLTKAAQEISETEDWF